MSMMESSTNARCVLQVTSAALVAVSQDCAAFMTDSDTSCDLYSECQVVSIDGCDDCNVHVCLENCPEDTKPYYVRRADYEDCNSKNEISSYDTECGSDCESDDFEKVRDDCADRCSETPGCNEFFLPDDHSACELYTTCDLDYHDDADDEGGYLGVFREKMNRQVAIICCPGSCAQAHAFVSQFCTVAEMEVVTHVIHITRGGLMGTGKLEPATRSIQLFMRLRPRPMNMKLPG